MGRSIIVLIGVSGSGKSTWSTNYIRENPNTLRINRDSIRLGLVGSLDGYYQRKDLNEIEGCVSYIESKMFKTILDNHRNVIIDNTNLKKSYIQRWINESLDYPHKIYFKLFDIVSVAECKKRVNVRDNIQNTMYIDKQFDQYQSIKKYIEETYKDFII